MDIKKPKCGMYDYSNIDPRCPCDYSEDPKNNSGLIKGILNIGIFMLAVGIIIFLLTIKVHADCPPDAIEDCETMRILYSPNLVVYIAKGEIGKGEMYGDNKGPEVEKYTRGHDVAWCSGFVSWVLKQSGYHDHYFLQARQWYGLRSKRVASPSPGCLIVFSRRNYQGHVGIVESVKGNTLVTIEGNLGRFPARVKEVHYRLNHIPHLLGFVKVI